MNTFIYFSTIFFSFKEAQLSYLETAVHVWSCFKIYEVGPELSLFQACIPHKTETLFPSAV